MPSGDAQLGRTIVRYPGHPLSGRVVPVVRRYGRRGAGQWVIELPDGSRQYLPVSWCSPLMSSQEPLPEPEPPQAGPLPSADPASPLSLTTLRDLAGVVRRLQEAAGQRREEHDNGGCATSGTARQEPAAVNREQPPPRETKQEAAGRTDLGELPGGGSSAVDQRDPANRPPASGSPPGEPRSEGISQP